MMEYIYFNSRDELLRLRITEIAYFGSTNLRQVFDNQEINMKNICSVQIK